MKWHESYRQVVDFGVVLYEANVLTGPDEIFGYFDAPGGYGPAYTEWTRLGQPTADERNWRAFCRWASETYGGAEDQDDDEDEEGAEAPAAGEPAPAAGGDA